MMMFPQHEKDASRGEDVTSVVVVDLAARHLPGRVDFAR